MLAEKRVLDLLVFDDDQATLGLFRDLPLATGHEVTLRSHLPDDPMEVTRIAPNVIPLDSVFDDVERGIPSLQALRQHPTRSSIPVLSCSATTQPVAQQADDPARASCGVVVKPFDIGRLLAALDSRVTDSGFARATG